MVVVFFVASVAILNMSYLNIDRYLLLNYSSNYRILTRRRRAVITIILWFSSFVVSLLQLLVNMPLFILLFSVCFILPTVIVMILTIRTFWKKFSPAVIKIYPGNFNQTSTTPTSISQTETSKDFQHIIQQRRSASKARKKSGTPSSPSMPGTTMKSYSGHSSTAFSIKTKVIIIDNNEKTEKFTFVRDRYERRIVVTLTIMTSLFVFFHLPIMLIGIYLNISRTIDFELQVSLDVVIVMLMLSAAIRPLVFIFRLGEMKEAVRKSFKRPDRRRKETYICNHKPEETFSTIAPNDMYL